MIENLFRGKTKQGNWVEGNGIMQGQDCVSYVRWVDICDDRTRYEVIPETVGRFTGLTDKNGKKIFEGDIVKTNIIYSGIVNVFIKEEIVEVKYIDGCFYPLYDYEKGKIEVIGNSHDNPELLEKTE